MPELYPNPLVIAASCVVGFLAGYGVRVVQLNFRQWLNTKLPAPDPTLDKALSFGIRRITVEGHLNGGLVTVNVRQGPMPRIWVQDKTSEEGLQALYRVEGDTLVICCDTKSSVGPDFEITLPSLEELRLHGDVWADLEGMSGNRLSVDIRGNASMEAADGRYDELKLTVSDSADADFEELPVRTANIVSDSQEDVCVTVTESVSAYARAAGDVYVNGVPRRRVVEVTSTGEVCF